MSMEIYIKSAVAYCNVCGKPEQAMILSRNGSVFLERLCAVQGRRSVKLAADYSWYQKRSSYYKNFSRPLKTKPSEHGCPNDCGVCDWHSNKMLLPVFSITNDCNLDCPKCFTYNRQDRKYYKSVEETERIIDNILETSGGVQLINLTGGEPTMHPDLFKIIEACKKKGVGRITMNSNGLRIASDKEFARGIKESGVQVILSLDTFDPEKSVKIYGRDISSHKRKTLENMEELEIPATLLSVAIKNLNEGEIAGFCRDYIGKSFVKSFTIQNMTYTGMNGEGFQPREHITIDEVEAAIASEEPFNTNDFFPMANYHFLCYSAAYYIVHEGRVISLTKLFDKDTLVRMMTDSYLLQPDRNFSKEFMDGVSKLWAEGSDPEEIKALKSFIKDAFPKDRDLSIEERRAFLESGVKMILIHPHMDEDNFDLERIAQCGDLVPDENGNSIPACSYNLLYRQKDERFWVEK